MLLITRPILWGRFLLSRCSLAPIMFLYAESEAQSALAGLRRIFQGVRVRYTGNHFARIPCARIQGATRFQNHTMGPGAERIPRATSFQRAINTRPCPIRL